jgi:TPR repeat protein
VFALCETEAKAGNPSAISNLGWCYLWGYGCERDQPRGVAHFELAAKKGCVTGHNNLAVCWCVLRLLSPRCIVAIFPVSSRLYRTLGVGCVQKFPALGFSTLLKLWQQNKSNPLLSSQVGLCYKSGQG